MANVESSSPPMTARPSGAVWFPLSLNPRAMAVLTPEAREAYLYSRNQVNAAPRERYADPARAFENDLALERKFVGAIRRSS